MSITSTTTTLENLGNFETMFCVASSADMLGPNPVTGRRTYLRLDEEFMGVERVLGPGLVLVTRGVLGSRAVPHAAGAAVEVVGENYGVDYCR